MIEKLLFGRTGHHSTRTLFGAAALGEAHGIRLSNHLFIEISTHLLCATPTAHWLEYAEWFNPIIEQPLRIVDGCAVLDERPGSGVEWNEEAVARYLVE